MNPTDTGLLSLLQSVYLIENRQLVARLEASTFHAVGLKVVRALVVEATGQACDGAVDPVLVTDQEEEHGHGFVHPIPVTVS